MDRGVWCPWGHKESDTTEQLHFHTIASVLFHFLFSFIIYFRVIVLVGTTKITIITVICKNLAQVNTILISILIFPGAAAAAAAAKLLQSCLTLCDP